MIEALFWLATCVIVYVYAGYPILLWLSSKLVRREGVPSDAQFPRVTLVISAYNEELSIRQKLMNSLEVDYPKAQIDILVVSDASDDQTDTIVAEFESEGVTLLRMPNRSGKTVGLNKAVSVASGEIIVFSDANAMYRRDAIAQIVRPFAEAGVGAVIGESTYTVGETESERSEGLYWRYECWLKEMESHVASVIGGDGAIYAVRRALYSPMRADALSDFVNPLQVVEQGHRCVYERRAQSVESAAEDFSKEFRRKVRIVNRAWRATVAMSGLLNPFKYGRFALCLISHKLLRWLVPLFLATAILCNLALLNASPFYWVTLCVQIGFYALALVACLSRQRMRLPAILYIPYYFCLVNVASLVGIFQVFRGETYTTWTTARAS